MSVLWKGKYFERTYGIKVIIYQEKSEDYQQNTSLSTPEFMGQSTADHQSINEKKEDCAKVSRPCFSSSIKTLCALTCASLT